MPPEYIQKSTPLSDAVLRCDYDAMRQIGAAGADLNELESFGMTALLWAIMRGDIAAARMLLESGADSNARPNSHNPPL
jgi:ankyrin repeat protein